MCLVEIQRTLDKEECVVQGLSPLIKVGILWYGTKRDWYECMLIDLTSDDHFIEAVFEP
jgi:hypothetical protein